MSKPKAPQHHDHPAVSVALPGITTTLRSGNLPHAIASINQLLTDAPNDARLHDLLSTALALSGNRDRAAHHAILALTLKPSDLPLVRRTVSVLQRAGLYQDALAHTERALYQHPADQMLNRIRITLLTDLGKHRQAAKAIENHAKHLDLTTPSESLAIALLSARLAPSHYTPTDIITKLDPILSAPTADALPKPMLKAAHFELARLLELQQEYDRAFETYAKANTYNELPWDPDAHSVRVTTLINQSPALTSAPVATYTHPTLSGKNIIFILGMMRSGSSLLEQILAQLPGITPTDEQPTLLQTITAIERELNPDEPISTFPMPLSIDRYTQDHLNTLAQNALTRYAELTADQPTTTYIIDKQTEHYHILPLLPKILPGCTIIHTARDPIDTCLSNFTQSFAQGHPQTSNLNWIARFHNDHDRLMAAWHAMDHLTIHEVNYADLVTNPETETQRLAEILDIPWTNKVLDFHKSTRTVTTASQQQVRQPLYTTSVGRAQRFATQKTDHLAPLRDALN